MHSEPIKACIFCMSPVRKNSQFYYLECVFTFLLEKEKANTQTRVRFLVGTGATEVAFLDSCNYQLLLVTVMPWEVSATLNRTFLALKLIICEGSQKQHEAGSLYIVQHLHTVCVQMAQTFPLTYLDHRF